MGSTAFEDWYKLEKITLSLSLADIIYSTFDDCHKLKEIVIPTSVINTRYKVFYNCFELSKVTFESPSSLVMIGDVFNICKSSFTNCLLTHIILLSLIYTD